MAPPRAACEALAIYEKSKQELMDKIKLIGAAVDAVIETLMQILMGTLSVKDLVLKELISAMEATAQAMAAALMAAAANLGSQVAAAAANASAALIEAVLSNLLKILMSGPAVIFSLVEIPRKEALRTASAERQDIDSFRESFNTVMSIIQSWLGTPEGGEYYKQIKDALPHVERAIQLNGALIFELMDGLGRESGRRNAYFNEEAFNSMNAEIDIAKLILTPQSTLLNKTGLSNRMAQVKMQIYSEKSRKIDADFDNRREVINLEYQTFMATQPPAPGDNLSLQDLNLRNMKNDNVDVVARLTNASTAEAKKLEWVTKTDALEVQHKEALAKAYVEAETASVTDARSYMGLMDDVKMKFNTDMLLISKALSDMLTSAQSAYANYLVCQTCCNTVVTIKSIILTIIKYMIQLMRGVGNGSADAVIAVLKGARAPLEVAKDSMTTAKSKFEAQSISKMELSATVAIAHTMVTASDTILHGTITQSLIDLINADDMLGNSSDDFNRFITRMSNIPDWDGRKGVWCVTPLKSAIPPYLQIVADTMSAIVQVPAVGLTKDQAGQSLVKGTVKRLHESIDKVSTHNSYVMQALYSYQPFVGPEVADLSAILAAAGLLSMFAQGMALADLVGQVVALSMTGLPDLSNSIPTHDNCMKDPEMAKLFPVGPAAKKMKTDLQPPAANKGIVMNWEKSKDDALALAIQVNDTRYFNNPVDDANT